jgi:hypothetical protein
MRRIDGLGSRAIRMIRASVILMAGNAARHWEESFAAEVL